MEHRRRSDDSDERARALRASSLFTNRVRNKSQQQPHNILKNLDKVQPYDTCVVAKDNQNNQKAIPMGNETNLNYHRYHQYQNNTYFWSSGDTSSSGYHNDDNVSTIIVIVALLLMLAFAPAICSLVQKHAFDSETPASDGDTVAVDEDLKDVEHNSVLEDISQRSVPYSLPSLHDSSVKGRKPESGAASP